MGEQEEFPEVQGGGSLILAWQIKNKKILIVGGGEVRSSSSFCPVYLLIFLAMFRWQLAEFSTVSTPTPP